ncbi:hypothetical protein AB1K84_18420 [Mesobacillus foraminis]|uniref:hypothetical protein n=1 Tax=Mesobacillus foraminis TaxID=279826 RepID=UPI00399F04DB
MKNQFVKGRANKEEPKQVQPKPADHVPAKSMKRNQDYKGKDSIFLTISYEYRLDFKLFFADSKRVIEKDANKLNTI